jgi:hypothetical protein
MVTGGGGVEGADLLIKAFGEVSVGVADSEPELTHHRSPSMGRPTAGSRRRSVSRVRGFRAA